MCALHNIYMHIRTVDVKSLQNILLKVCYFPATSAQLPRLVFFAAAISSTNEANMAGSMHC